MTFKVELDGRGAGLTEEEIAQHLRTASGGYTTEEMRAAFKLVRDVDDWKNPIDAVVDRDKWHLLEHAIPWFTGTGAHHEDVPGQPDKIRVMADGYYAGPCN